MTIKEQLRANFPKTVNKTGSVFSSLVANEEGTGAIEYELNHLIEFMKDWTGTPDIYEQHGDMLDMTVQFYSFLERFTDETENSIKNRFGAIFVRGHDSVWGTPHDVKDVFRQYFPSAVVYLVENTNNAATENLITDGEFTTDSNDWIYNGSPITTADLSADARFSKEYGVELANNDTLSQSVSLSIETGSTETFFLHFFMKGKCKVSVKNNSNKYWNPLTETWTDNAAYAEYDNSDWDNCSLFFFADDTVTGVEIEFIGTDSTTAAFLDYVRLFQKRNYPSFTVIVHFEGDSSSVKILKLAPGEADQSAEISDYTLYYYFDHSFMSGVAAGFAQDIYDDLLDYMRAQGVKAYLDIVVKDYNE